MFAPAVSTLPTHERTDSIKVLDLLTNRYHLGIIRETTDAALRVELPASSQLQAGQRVRFIVAGRQPLVSRMSMQKAFITDVSPHHANRMNVRLSLVQEPALA